MSTALGGDIIASQRAFAALSAQHGPVYIELDKEQRIHMARHSMAKLIPVISFLLGSLLGSGVIWQVQQARMANRSHELAITLGIAELREKITDLSFKIIQLSDEYIMTRDAHDRNPTNASYAKAGELKYKLDLLKDDYWILEQKLANMENRTPRELQIDFTPLRPPILMSIEPLPLEHGKSKK